LTGTAGLGLERHPVIVCCERITQPGSSAWKNWMVLSTTLTWYSDPSTRTPPTLKSRTVLPRARLTLSPLRAGVVRVGVMLCCPKTMP